MEYNSILIFIISAFCLGAVLILMKNTIPPVLKRWLAMAAAFMILIAFILIVYSFLTMGS